MCGLAKVSIAATNINFGNSIAESSAYAHALELGQDHGPMTTPVGMYVSVGTVYGGMESNRLVTQE